MRVKGLECATFGAYQYRLHGWFYCFLLIHYFYCTIFILHTTLPPFPWYIYILFGNGFEAKSFFFFKEIILHSIIKDSEYKVLIDIEKT
jgi:hypothetical protein